MKRKTVLRDIFFYSLLSGFIFGAVLLIIDFACRGIDSLISAYYPGISSGLSFLLYLILRILITFLIMSLSLILFYLAYNRRKGAESRITSTEKKGEREHLGEKLKQQIEEQKILLSNIPVQIFLKDKDLKLLTVNKAYADFVELPVDEILGKTDYELYTREQADLFNEEEKEVLEDGISINDVEKIITTRSGKERWVSVSKIPLRDSRGGIIGLVGFFLDVTKEKVTKVEKDLLVTAIDQASETVVITNTDGIIQYVNPAFETTSGYDLMEILGQNLNILKSDKCDEAFYKGVWDFLKTGKIWKGHFVSRKKDGAFYEEEATISPVRNSDGEISNYVVVKRDVTQELVLEEQLLQSQKMEAMGRLAGGVAHDFNNFLAAILGYSDILLASLPENDPNRNSVEEIKKSGKRASALTKQLLAFCRRQMIKPKSLSINNVILDMGKMLQQLVGENVKLNFNLAAELYEIMADPSQIEQIIMNLAVNSKDAMPEGGQLTVETSNINLTERHETGDFQTPPGEYVKLSVIDTGFGMDKETIKHVFEPFFTTKPKGKGTGLGLSTVYGIIKQHNGFITIRSELNQGTSIEVYFPCRRQESA